VFREAIRLLEHHSVAAMRRGPGGGLVVLSPNPAASIEAAALYLDYRGAKVEDLHQVREALELGVIDLLAAKAGDSDMMRRLSEALVASEPTDDIAEPSNHLHIAMAAMAGNAVVDLLLQIAIALWARHTAASADPPAEISATVTRTHHGIIDAIAAGDHSIARHRMRKHLTALTEWWT
jgi:DNA-binding FadR family transcriptional regulator